MGPTKTKFGRESDRPRLILVPELQSGAVVVVAGTVKGNLLTYTQFCYAFGRTARTGGLEGLGLTDCGIVVRLEFPAPCGCGPWLWAAGCGAAAKEMKVPPDRK